MIAVSITGALYVFRPQIEPALQPDLYFVDEIGDSRASFNDVEGRILASYPGWELESFNINKDPERNGVVRLHKIKGDEAEEDEYRWLFFNPFSGEIVGEQTFSGFFQVVLNIHRTLLVGLPGRILVELATCWAIVSVWTGLFLWWRQRNGIKGFLIPRIKGPWPTILRDWHTVPGAYLSLVVLAIMGTGLLFSKVWGTAWLAGNAFTGGLPDFYLNPPKSAIVAGEDPGPRISPEEAYLLANAAYDFRGKTHTLVIPHHSEDDTYQVITDITKPLEGIGVVHLDAFSGEPLLVETGEDMPLRTHFTLLFYPVHTGIIGGLATQIIAFIACLFIVLMSITGVMMWWRRRPRGKFGAPVKQGDEEAPVWAVFVTILFGVLMPTVGITLVLLALGSFIAGKLRPKAQETVQAIPKGL